jgi:hypothetical protein
MDKRQDFLTDFLGALGAQEIRFSQITPESISGTVIYDSADPDEQQDFRWLPTLMPSATAQRLAIADS